MDATFIRRGTVFRLCGRLRGPKHRQHTRACSLLVCFDTHNHHFTFAACCWRQTLRYVVLFGYAYAWELRGVVIGDQRFMLHRAHVLLYAWVLR